MKNFTRVLFALLLSVTGYTQSGERVANRLAPLQKGDWSLVILPDTQVYSRTKSKVSMFEWMLSWIQQNKDERNIKAVLQVGDIVDNNLTYQWKLIQKSLRQLDGQVPYFFAQGNHDVGVGGYAISRDSPYNDYFSPSNSSLNQSAFGGNYEPGRYENSYYYVNANDEKLLILLLEFAPRDEVLEWANQVATAHPKHKIMLVLHEFMDEASRLKSRDGLPTRSTRDTHGSAHDYPVHPRAGQRNAKNSKNAGEDIWQKLISKHHNFEFVFSGHHSDYQEPYGGRLKAGRGAAKAFRADDVRSKLGSTRVHQFMFDSQWIPSGGDTWMIVVQFSADGRSARAQTYAPLLEYYPNRVTAPDVFAEAWDLARNPGAFFERFNFGDFTFPKF